MCSRIIIKWKILSRFTECFHVLATTVCTQLADDLDAHMFILYPMRNVITLDVLISVLTAKIISIIRLLEIKTDTETEVKSDQAKLEIVLNLF